MQPVEEVVVSRERKSWFADRFGVNGDDVGELKRDVRKIVGKKFLSLGAEFLPFSLIHFYANLIG
jgi:hypothetical protein